MREDLRNRVAFWLIVASNLLIVSVAGYFAWVTDAQNEVLATSAAAASEQNRVIVQEIRRELRIHGHASADRACASSKGLLYLVRQADVKPQIERRFTDFVERSCEFVNPATGKEHRPKAGGA